MVTCQQRVHFDSLRDFPLSGVGDENDVEDVRLLIVSVLEVRWGLLEFSARVPRGTQGSFRS